MSEDKSQEYKKRLSIELTNSLYRAEQDPAYQAQRDANYRSDHDPLYWNDVSVISVCLLSQLLLRSGSTLLE